jgi:selenocysteine-specific elongation factor
LGARPSDAAALAGAEEPLGTRRISDRVYAVDAVEHARTTFLRLVDEHHASAPLEPGAPLQSIRARLGAPQELADLIVREASATGAVRLDGGLVARRDWTPRLTDRQVRVRGALLGALQQAGQEPPSVAELEAVHGHDVLPILRLLEREKRVVAVEADRWFDREVLDELIGRLRAGMRPGQEHTPGELRDILGFSRKYLIPFLEYCDRLHITERRSSGRVLIGP